ncbi:hypothetical protein Hanom_Chr03g00190031 [Helianthus anomalus]
MVCMCVEYKHRNQQRLADLRSEVNMEIRIRVYRIRRVSVGI